MKDKDLKLLKKVIKKAHLITYIWKGGYGPNCRCGEYLNDSNDRKTELKYILDKDVHNCYDLSQKVYLYRQVRNQIKLIAVISDKGVKVCR